MKRITFILTLFLIPLAAQAQGLWHIAWLKPSPVQIDGRPMQVGDEFRDGATVEWSDNDQVIKAIETESRRCLVLSARALPENSGHRLRDYIDVCEKLSTRSRTYRESVSRGEGLHYLGFVQGGRTETLIPFEGMFMDELPQEIWLCYVNTDTGEKRVETRDFRALMDDLIVTDDMVCRIIADMGYDPESYLSLLSQFMEEKHRGIPLSTEEIHLYLTLKY